MQYLVPSAVALQPLSVRERLIDVSGEFSIYWEPSYARVCANCHQRLAAYDREKVNLVWWTWERFQQGEYVYLHKRCSSFRGQEVFYMEEVCTFFPPWRLPWGSWIGKELTTFIQSQWQGETPQSISYFTRGVMMERRRGTSHPAQGGTDAHSPAD